MNKLIITDWKDKILTALVSNGEITELNLEPADNISVLNNIYIGKVNKIVSNINAAFIDFGSDMAGYYSLIDNKVHHFVKPHTGKLKEGDEIVVQVSRDRVKTKAEVLSSILNFTGRYAVLTAGKTNIGFSVKIKDDEWKKSFKEKLLEIKDEDFGIIVRTNAAEAADEDVIKEIESLKMQYRRVIEQAKYRTCYSLLYKSLPAFITSIRDSYADNLAEIVTDKEDIYELAREYTSMWTKDNMCSLSLYNDKMLSLKKLYSLETAMEKAVNKRVWLNSGGYLVIEPTEALVVIDVNTGKYSGKKTFQDTILKINMEAAKEIAKQLRLRNLSGIIIIDFIDMEREADKKQLLEQLSSFVAADSVKTVVLGITKLNLVEVTRKKVRRPLYEQIADNREKQ